MTAEEDQKLEETMRRACEMILEFGDSVQIIATVYSPGEDGKTSLKSFGTGNWYARWGATKQWVDDNTAAPNPAREDKNEEEDQN